MRWRSGLAGAYVAALVASYAFRGGGTEPSASADVETLTVQAVDGDQRSSAPVRLAYREYRGRDGKVPIVLLHGSPGGSVTFAGLAPLLAADRVVLVPDLPGFGQSSRRIPDYSFAAHARYVRDLLDALGIRRAHVLGFSMGGGVALSFADLAPDRLASLTMLSAIGVQEFELLGEYHVNHVIHGAQLAGLWTLGHLVPHTGSLDAPLPYARNFFDSDQRPLADALRRVAVPTFIVHGRADPLVPIEAAIEHARLIPQSELRIVEDDHFMVFDDPQRLATIIGPFLRRVDSGEAATRAQAPMARLVAATRPFDPRIVPRARAVNAVVLGGLFTAGSACGATVAAIGAGVLVAQGRSGAAMAFICCALGSLMASVRRRSIIGSARAMLLAAGAVAVGVAAGSAWFSTSMLAGADAWTRAAVVTTATTLVVWLSILACSYRRRRLLVSSWVRLTHWEYWPPWITYVPVAAFVLWLMLRHRSATAFTAANPAIPAGGFIGESKIDILRGLGTTRNAVARSGLIDGTLPREGKLARAAQLMQTLALELPVVLKPDVGQRGAGVVVARSKAEMTSYLESTTADTILQEYIPGVEFGVFYYRHPLEPRGHILSMTEKHLPAVVGDAMRSLERLILEDRRSLGMARFHLRRHRTALRQVPAKDVRISLGDCGSHCRGATFLDGSRWLTPSVDDAFDEIAQGYAGFYFGRFDVRSSSTADFTAGRFTIIELNGVTSEATHIYDPEVTLIEAYRALFDQWRLAFEIGAANIARGARAWTVFELVGLVRRYRQGGDQLIGMRQSRR